MLYLYKEVLKWKDTDTGYTRKLKTRELSVASSLLENAHVPSVEKKLIWRRLDAHIAEQ